MTINKIIVHSGTFHADDVMCAALAKAINPEVQIERVFKVPETLEEGTIVADIGGGKYDHHQGGVCTREDGGERSACGLLFEDLKGDIFPTKRSADKFEQDFIIPIEDQDNGKSTNPLSNYIAGLNPSWDSKESADECFLKAVDVMSDLISSQIERELSAIRGNEIVQDALKSAQNRVAVLSQFAPWQNAMAKEDIDFVIFSSNRGGYNLQAVPAAPGSRENKIKLPEEWLSQAPEGCSFVHQGRFLASFDTEENALAAAYSIEKARDREEGSLDSLIAEAEREVRNENASSQKTEKVSDEPVV